MTENTCTVNPFRMEVYKPLATCHLLLNIFIFERSSLEYKPILSLLYIVLHTDEVILIALYNLVIVKVFSLLHLKYL